MKDNTKDTRVINYPLSEQCQKFPCLPDPSDSRARQARLHNILQFAMNLISDWQVLSEETQQVLGNQIENVGACVFYDDIIDDMETTNEWDLEEGS